MTPWERALQLVDEAADAVRFGEGDEWSPFDPVDDLTLAECDRLLVEVNLLKRAARLTELQVRHRLEGLLVDSDETVSVRGQTFPAVRFGPTVHVFRPKPTSPKAGPEFAAWAGSDVDRLARFEIRKSELFKVADERGLSVGVLVDSGIVEWPEPDGVAVLESIDLHSSYAPKWAESVPDKWEA